MKESTRYFFGAFFFYLFVTVVLNYFENMLPIWFTETILWVGPFVILFLVFLGMWNLYKEGRGEEKAEEIARRIYKVLWNKLLDNHKYLPKIDTKEGQKLRSDCVSADAEYDKTHEIPLPSLADLYDRLSK